MKGSTELPAKCKKNNPHPLLHPHNILEFQGERVDPQNFQREEKKKVGYKGMRMALDFSTVKPEIRT